MLHGIPWIKYVMKEIPHEINNFLIYILFLCMKENFTKNIFWVYGAVYLFTVGFKINACQLH